MTLVAGHPLTDIDESELVVSRRIHEFSEISGTISDVQPGEPYAVSYRRVDAVHGRGRVVRSVLVALANFLFEALFLIWLFQPDHRPPATGPAVVQLASWFVIASILVYELMRLVNIFSLSLATVIARDPVPVEPEADQRIAFLTSIVPSKEPIDVVRGTLQAALRIRYNGILDVWLLDEGDDPAVKAMCRELGVNHFTRAGSEKFNRKTGSFRAKSKHGNYNSWIAKHGDRYDIYLAVDPDHVPLPNYAERVLGYFRDPDVAYVVGPQCYANDDTFVTRGAESSQFAFHSLVQRAANSYNVAMLVGTNNAIRVSAIKSVGGISDSITEDLATGLKLHTSRNSATRRRWKSVYTPDVLAVGEGPSSWGDFFNQQLRWSRGSFEVMLREAWTQLPKLSPRRFMHYSLILNFYPSVALGWLFGAVNAWLFIVFGVQGIAVPAQLWFALFVDATVFQLWVYVRNRRYNVSPYELEGSTGAKGIVMGIFATPIYASALVATVLRLPTRFVVTPKGVSTSADRLITFRRQLQWAASFIAAMIIAVVTGHGQFQVLLWPAASTIACLLPVALWIGERVVGRRPVVEATPAHTADGRAGLTTESLERAALDLTIGSTIGAPSRSLPPSSFPSASSPDGHALEGHAHVGPSVTALVPVIGPGPSSHASPRGPGRDGRPPRPRPGPTPAPRHGQPSGPRPLPPPGQLTPIGRPHPAGPTAGSAAGRSTLDEELVVGRGRGSETPTGHDAAGPSARARHRREDDAGERQAGVRGGVPGRLPPATRKPDNDGTWLPPSFGRIPLPAPVTEEGGRGDGEGPGDQSTEVMGRVRDGVDGPDEATECTATVAVRLVALATAASPAYPSTSPASERDLMGAPRARS